MIFLVGTIHPTHLMQDALMLVNGLYKKLFQLIKCALSVSLLVCKSANILQ